MSAEKIEITPEMIKAGVEALVESGILPRGDENLSYLDVVVEDIFRAMQDRAKP